MRIKVIYSVTPSMVMVKLPRMRVVEFMQGDSLGVHPGDEIADLFLVCTRRGWSYRGRVGSTDIIIPGPEARPSAIRAMRVAPSPCPFTLRQGTEEATMDEREVHDWARRLLQGTT